MKNTFNKVSITQIPEKTLLPGVIKALRGREMFIDADSLDERIYSGDVFEAIDCEEAEKGGSPIRIKDEEVLKQIKELAEIIDTEYVQITTI